MQSYKLLRRLLPLIHARWPLVLFGYFCTLLGVACSLIQPLLFSKLIDNVLYAGERSMLVPILLLSAGFALLSALLGIGRGLIFRYLDVRHMLDLRDRVLAHLRRIQVPEIERHGPGKYSALLGWDTTVASSFMNHVIVELLIQSMTIVVAIAMIFYMDWRMGLAAVLIVPLIFLIPRLYQKPLSHYSRTIRSHNEEVMTFMYETIQSSREIRVFGLENWEKQRNEKLYRNLLSNSMRQSAFQMLTGQSSALAIGLLIVLLYGFGSGRVMDGTLSIGMLVAGVQYFNNLLQPIVIMNHLNGEIKSSEVAVEKIEQFLAIEEDVALSSPDRQPQSASAQTASRSGLTPESSPSAEPDSDSESEPVPGITPRAVPPLLEAIQLKVFYEDTEILKGIDFSIHAGQHAAFVGRSGSGKTTLFKAVLGLAHAEPGSLLIGSPDHGDSPPSMGAVFQETFIFAGTLYENIALGQLSATEKEVYEAACQAGLQAYVDSLPEGLHARVDNQGFQLSGGQRQRVALARMFLRRPDILILDEPTSALDRVTENQVLTSLKQRMEGRTVLISTHRLDTIRSADVIYVMNQGLIVDYGTHEELSVRSELYKKLLSESYQNREQELTTA
ncbi:ABC transporter ATP-binding protein [Paenibacillus sp. NPDC058071]|uniref:ABC transporter ATP-binding protein n=1 Tax=Paenibacillus sp. NPDC058071 TaxID=3346326 RepID=UPI0036DDBC16